VTDPNAPLTPPGDPGPGPEQPSYPAPQPSYPAQPSYPPQQAPYPQGYATGHGSPYLSPQTHYGPPSTAMASWALGLSFLFCMPVAVLAAIGLAIAVLVKSTPTPDHGRKKAIAALVISGVWVVAFVVLVALSALGVIEDDASRDEEGRVTEIRSIPITSLEVGDCFDDPATRGVEDEAVGVTNVTVKPCSYLHDFELYAEFDLEGDDYPGEADVQKMADAGCLARVEDYADPESDVMDAAYYYYYPRKARWKINHDRSVQCMFSFDSGQTRGSLRKK